MQWLSLVLALQQVPAVEIPRIETDARVDGVLDEQVWAQAARLDNFTQYEPVDGRPAAERTEVLVWYAPDAIWFGIVAHDSQPDAIRATRADRDNISDDDHVIIYLDTFLDRRRAFFFGANALGVQTDGVRTEGASSAGRTFGGNIDTSPDFLFETRGRVTDSGYVIEMRVPFKSLRYPSSSRAMQWGINIERQTQRTGFTDTWPDVRRASASFLAQGGVLSGLHDLERGVVIEAQPFLTLNAPGTRISAAAPGVTRFERASSDVEVGANVRLGFTNFALDATINPDFSQIEADAAQVTVNELFALFFPEKRPFFLEGIELFATPNQLVYTRRIANPSFGGKFTGKVGGLTIAHLTALDEDVNDAGDDALFNITRLRRDIGANSSVGVTFTDRTLDLNDAYNRVASADTRIVFGGMYYFEGQLGGSWTAQGDAVHSAAIWKLELDRTGRAIGFNWALNGVGENFEAHSGFVNRHNIINANAFNRYTWYGTSGAALERVTTFVGLSRILLHSDPGDGAIEGEESVNTTLRFRGDWEAGARVGRGFVDLDPADYLLYEVMTPTGPLPFSPRAGMSGREFSINGRTPVFQGFDARASVGTGDVAIFAEASEGQERSASASVSLRPAASVRISVGSTFQRITRQRDGSEFARTLLPRMQAEYQPTRAFFLRAIGEYRAERRDALRDPQTGTPLRIRGVTSTRVDANGARIDLLASYQPTPGTVAFLGYGASLSEDESFSFRGLERQNDGFLLKLAYLLRR